MKEIKNNSNIESIENIDSLLKVDKNSKTFYGICLLFITLILLILFMLIFTKRNSISKSELRIDENSLILIKENDKYGFINTNGKTIISPKYDKADIFIGNYAKVLDDETYVLIDKNGKELFKSKNSNDIEYIKDYNVWLILENLYDSNMNKLNSKNTMIKYIDKGYFKWINENNKKAGIMNYKGKVTYTYNLSKDEKNFSFNEIGYENEFDKDKYYCIISVDNTKYGIVNCNTGKIVYDFTENNISKKISSCFEIKNIKNYSFIERIIVANNKVVYKTKENNEIIYNYDYYFNIYNPQKRNNYYISKIDGKEYSTEPQIGKKIETKTELEKLLKIEKVSCDDGYGLKIDNKLKLKCKYKELLYFPEDVMKYLSYKNKNYIVVFDDKYSLINYKTGKIITTFDTDRLVLLDNSLFIEYTNNDKKYVYSLLKNKTLEYNLDDKIALYSNYYTVKKDNSLEYYNIDMKKIYTN